MDLSPINEKNNPIHRYEELDALRGIAAIMVVLFHLTLYTEVNVPAFLFGATGVDLFFIISGFVIFMSLNKVVSSKEFIINRISRLYPTYWFCVSFTFLLLSVYALYKHTGASVIEYLANMTMFQYYLGQPNIDASYWTMIIEMLFYIAVLFLFHFKIIRYTNLIFLFVCVVTTMLVCYGDKNDTKELIERVPLLQFLPLFFAGITFYNIYHRKNSLQLNYAVLCVCFVCEVIIFKDFSRFITQAEYAWILALYFVVFILFVHGKLKFIVSRATLFLGKISFALYLIHQCITARFIMPLCIHTLHVNVWVVIFFIAFPLAIILATLITYYIDVPWSYKMRQKLRTLFL